MAVVLLCTALVVLAFVVLVSLGRDGTVETPAQAAAAESQGATDRVARLTFRRQDGAVGLRLLRDAPSSSQRVRGAELQLVCGYQGVAGLTLLSRDFLWPAGAPTARVPVDPGVLAATEFCALKQGALAVGRVVFG